MFFVDEATIEVCGGRGGNGCSAMRREKYIPLGGPAGGDGGDGGDVILVADPGLTTLYDIHFRRVFRGQDGEPGRGKDQHGRGGQALRVRVPLGTQVYDAQTKELLVDLDHKGSEFIVAHGGSGGRGNRHFVTPYDRAPTRCEAGIDGEFRHLRLELKVLADVGILGFPNAGKSTFIAAVSRARPKIADYPFTTLTPNLGVVSLGDDRSFVIADVPGIIEGAAAGAGLGIQFLKHVERTRVLLVLITLDPDPQRNPISDFNVLLRELAHFDEKLAARPKLVVLSKIDLPEVQAQIAETSAAVKELGYPLMTMSSATGVGVQEVLIALESLLQKSHESSTGSHP